MDDEDTTDTVDATQADLDIRLARLWSTIEILDRHSWRLLEGAVVGDDARASLTAAYTSATAAARTNGLTDSVGAAVRATLAVVATVEGEISWTAKRWVEYAATALVCRTLLVEDLLTDDDDAEGEAGAEADASVEGEAEPRLVGGDFGWVEYEILTCTWRGVVGDLHPDDPPMIEDPPDEPDDDGWLEPAEDLPDEAPLDEHGATSARDRVDALWVYLNRPVSLTLRRSGSARDGEGSRRLAVAGRGR